MQQHAKKETRQCVLHHLQSESNDGRFLAVAQQSAIHIVS